MHVYKPAIHGTQCSGTEVPMIFSKSKLVVFSISMSEEGVAMSCKLNGLVNNYNVVHLRGKEI